MKDSVAAYDQLADAMRPYNITPLFRKEQGGKQLIYLVQSPPIPKLSANWMINIILFIVTFFSMMLMGVDVPPEAMSGERNCPPSYSYFSIFLPVGPLP